MTSNFDTLKRVFKLHYELLPAEYEICCEFIIWKRKWTSCEEVDEKPRATPRRAVRVEANLLAVHILKQMHNKKRFDIENESRDIHVSKFVTFKM